MEYIPSQEQFYPVPKGCYKVVPKTKMVNVNKGEYFKINDEHNKCYLITKPCNGYLDYNMTNSQNKNLSCYKNMKHVRVCPKNRCCYIPHSKSSNTYKADNLYKGPDNRCWIQKEPCVGGGSDMKLGGNNPNYCTYKGNLNWVEVVCPATSC